MGSSTTTDRLAMLRNRRDEAAARLGSSAGALAALRHGYRRDARCLVDAVEHLWILCIPGRDDKPWNGVVVLAAKRHQPDLFVELGIFTSDEDGAPRREMQWVTADGT